MNSPRRLALTAFAFAAVLLFLRLGDLPLADPDEGRNATVAREMLDRGEWWIPTYNGVVYLDKPALFFRMVAASMALLGPNEAAARLPSAICALMLLVAIFVFCRRYYDGRTAALAVAVTGSAPLFFAFGRTVIFDMPLALAVTVAILAAHRAEQDVGSAAAQGADRTGDAGASGPALPRWSGGRWHALAAASVAVAVLLKGPVGLIVPGLVTIAARLLQPRGARRPGFARRALAPLNLVIFFALTLPWFVGVLQRRPDFAHYGLVEETFRRYATTSFHRTAPWWYYGPVLMATFFPWCALLPEGIVAAWRRREAWTPADRLFLATAVVVVLFFSTSRSKLPGYILVAVVALGVLVARVFAGALKAREIPIPGPDSGGSRDRPGPGPAVFSFGASGGGSWAGPVMARRLVRRAALILALLAVLGAGFLGVVVVDPDAPRRIFQIHSAEFERLRPAFLPVGGTLAVVAVLAAAGWLTRRAEWALAAYLLFPLSVVTVSFGAIRTSIEAGSSRGLAAGVPKGVPAACLSCLPNGLPFYLDRHVVLLTRDGRELTSNYARYRLRQGDPWPATLVPLAERDLWLERRSGPVFLIAKGRQRAALDSLATKWGGRVSELSPGWWGTLLPAPANGAEK